MSRVTKDTEDFIAAIPEENLLSFASSLKPDAGCWLGNSIVGGFNYLVEIQFSDGTRWLARFPMPHKCSSQRATDFLLFSYASTLRYLARTTTIPVPDVITCLAASSPANSLGFSFMIMQRVRGRALDELIYADAEPNWTACDETERTRAAAEKVYRQLAGYALQLASLRWDKIGSLMELPVGSGNFSVHLYMDARTAHPAARGQIYESAIGPRTFSSASAFHSALLDLNALYALHQDRDGDEPAVYSAAVKTLRRVQAKYEPRIQALDSGPFVLGHDDLSSCNILVDEEFNITALLDFPGTIVPLPALCAHPKLLWELQQSGNNNNNNNNNSSSSSSNDPSAASPWADEKLWERCMLEAAAVAGSALNDEETRRQLVELAKDSASFYLALVSSRPFRSIRVLARRFGVAEE